MVLPLFDDLVPPDRQHSIYRRLKLPGYEPECQVLLGWSEGFVDRDGKFCREFQTTFEPCLWELYLHACFREIGATFDWSNSAPDFLLTNRGLRFAVEATIAAPSADDTSNFSRYDGRVPIEDLNEFNAHAVLRISNSFSKKVQRYRDSYSKLANISGSPYVIAIGAYDRPYAHFAVTRPILAALYGVYFDEEQTLKMGSPYVVNYPVDSVQKNESTTVPLGLFADDRYSDVSAVVYSCLATFGKIRALAVNPSANITFTSFHPSPQGLIPLMRTASNTDYQENLLDGLYIFHNPYARQPISPKVFEHPRVAQLVVQDDGSLMFEGPDDLLLIRQLFTVASE